MPTWPTNATAWTRWTRWTSLYDMGPMERHSAPDAEDAPLRAAREACLGWDIMRVFGGYLAVPKGTPVIQSIDTDGIVEKIRRSSAQH